MVTFLVSFCRIDVVSIGRLRLAEAFEICTAGLAPSLDGTARVPQPDANKSVTAAAIIDP